MSLSPAWLRDGLLQPNRLGGGRIGALGTAVLPGEFASAFGGDYLRPAGGFTIGTAGAIDFGIFPPDAVHILSVSMM